MPSAEALRSPRTKPVDAPRFDAPRLAPIFRDGFLVALLNPKTALFFAAFLPQFIDPAGSAIGQSVALGGLFVAIAASTDAGYVIAAHLAAPAFVRAGSGRHWGRYLTAGAYIALAVFTAAFSSRSSARP